MGSPEYARRRLLYLQSKGMESTTAVLANDTWIGGISRWDMSDPNYAKIESLWGVMNESEQNYGYRAMRPMLNIVPYETITFISAADAQNPDGTPNLTGGISTGAVTNAASREIPIRTIMRHMSALDAKLRLKMHIYLSSLIVEKIYDYDCSDDDVFAAVTPWISPTAPIQRLAKNVAPYGGVDIIAIDIDVYRSSSPDKNTLKLPWE